MGFSLQYFTDNDFGTLISGRLLDGRLGTEVFIGAVKERPNQS